MKKKYTIRDLMQTQAAVRLRSKEDADFLCEILCKAATTDDCVRASNFSPDAYWQHYNWGTCDKTKRCCGFGRQGLTGCMEEEFYRSFNRPVFDIDDIIADVYIDMESVYNLIQGD